MDVIARALPWVVAMLLFAALTHFIAILILPAVATRDAYDRLEAWGKSDHMALMPPVAPGAAIIPFRDPATVQGMCFYDLAKAPVRVKATVEEGRLLTLSFRTREGKVFYAMNDRAALRDTIDIHLLSERQLASVEASEDEDRGLSAELRLKAPTAKGLIVATALVARPSEREDAEARIMAISCAPEPLPPG